MHQNGNYWIRRGANVFSVGLKVSTFANVNTIQDQDRGQDRDWYETKVFLKMKCSFFLVCWYNPVKKYRSKCWYSQKVSPIGWVSTAQLRLLDSSIETPRQLNWDFSTVRLKHLDSSIETSQQAMTCHFQILNLLILSWLTKPNIN